MKESFAFLDLDFTGGLENKVVNIKSTNEYYSARAEEYDRVYLKEERQNDLRAIEEWLPTVFDRCALIEIACGTGYWTQFLAPVVQKLFAMDLSPETLAIARDRITSQHVEFSLGDAFQLPTRSHLFSAAFAGFWFSHIPRQRITEFLQGLHALLVPGSRVVFLDNRFVEGSSTPISEQDEWGNTYQTRHLRDGSIHRVLKNFPSELELRASVESFATHVYVHT